jgi:DNA-directed RNA polymerase specialized sigma24 family protein
MDWQTFHSRNAPMLSALARKLHREKPLPAAVGVEDVEQEVLLAAWVALSTYRDDAGRMSPEAYATYCGKRNARHALAAQRNAKRRRTTAPSRIEAPASDALDSEGCILAGVAPSQAVSLAFVEALRTTLATLGTSEGDALRAWVESGCDVDAAATVVGDARTVRAVVKQLRKELEAE